MNVRRRIGIRGIVQGVGFRPFVYNLAIRFRLAGSVLNNKLGVTIEIEGDEIECEKFFNALGSETPPLARIADVKSETIPTKNESRFRILESEDGGDDVGLVSPDNDVCPNCIKELLDINDRRYRYPFTNCTDCGPRYTIIKKTPYDRPGTSMAGFKMCPDCQKEYDDPSNRRFHAQPNACPVCGPMLELLGSNGETIKTDDHVGYVVAEINKGKIVAIKGIGGYHLACDATDEEAVTLLRDRKYRKEKPFAVMSRDIETIKSYAYLSEDEERLLTSREKPILLLKKREGSKIAESIAPGLEEIGVFLPYTPLHHLLFAIEPPPPTAIVMTSGNLSDEPIVFDESGLLEKLGGVADLFLVNDRPIVWRCDDSVVKTSEGRTMITRRSRGFVPAPVFIDKKAPPILACGGDLKSVFCIAKGNTIFPGPHIGDLEHAEAFDSFRESIEHFKRVFEIEPEVVVVDKHPGYFSSNYGRALGLPVIEVQHHHAHVASVMLEHKLDRDVIGLALDGTGYGDDGTIWGGEVLLSNLKTFERLYHFPVLKLPGGDKAAKEPWRAATALLYETFGENLFNAHPELVTAIGERKIKTILSMITSDTNVPQSTSAGRLFDAVASLLMVSQNNNYEGESPILLEARADQTVKKTFGFNVGENGEITFPGMVEEIVNLAREGKTATASAMFHNTIASALAETCRRISKSSGIKDVCLGGGAFQNSLLVSRLIEELERDRFTVWMPRQFPINDGGIAPGQTAIALAQL